MVFDILSGKIDYANNILNAPLRDCVPKLYGYKSTDEADSIVDGLTTAQHTLFLYFKPDGEIFKDIKQYSVSDTEKLYVIITIMSMYDSVENNLLDADIADRAARFMPKVFNISLELVEDYLWAVSQTQVLYAPIRQLIDREGFWPADIDLLLWEEIRNNLHTLPVYDPMGKDVMKAAKQRSDFGSCYSYAFIGNKNGKITLTVT